MKPSTEWSKRFVKRVVALANRQNSHSHLRWLAFCRRGDRRATANLRRTNRFQSDASIDRDVGNVVGLCPGTDRPEVLCASVAIVYDCRKLLGEWTLDAGWIFYNNSQRPLLTLIMRCAVINKTARNCPASYGHNEFGDWWLVAYGLLAWKNRANML